MRAFCADSWASSSFISNETVVQYKKEDLVAEQDTPGSGELLYLEHKIHTRNIKYEIRIIYHKSTPEYLINQHRRRLVVTTRYDYFCSLRYNWAIFSVLGWVSYSTVSEATDKHSGELRAVKINWCCSVTWQPYDTYFTEAAASTNFLTTSFPDLTFSTTGKHTCTWYTVDEEQGTHPKHRN